MYTWLKIKTIEVLGFFMYRFSLLALSCHRQQQCRDDVITAITGFFCCIMKLLKLSLITS